MSLAPTQRTPARRKQKSRCTNDSTKHSLVECVLFTGRNHQIRVHLSDLGIRSRVTNTTGRVGSIRKSPRFDGDEPAEDRHALHAASLGFFHPILREWMQFRTDPPEDFWAVAGFEFVCPQGQADQPSLVSDRRKPACLFSTMLNVQMTPRTPRRFSSIAVSLATPSELPNANRLSPPSMTRLPGGGKIF